MTTPQLIRLSYNNAVQTQKLIKANGNNVADDIKRGPVFTIQIYCYNNTTFNTVGEKSPVGLKHFLPTFTVDTIHEDRTEDRPKTGQELKMTFYLVSLRELPKMYRNQRRLVYSLQTQEKLF